MKSNLSNEYYKRKLRDLIKVSGLYTERFDGAFINLEDKRIILNLKDWFVAVSDIRQVSYTCGSSFDYLLDVLDREVDLVQEFFDGEIDA